MVSEAHRTSLNLSQEISIDNESLDIFELIPDETILYIILLLPINSIFTLCLTNKKLNNIISCEYFWKQKFIKDNFVPYNYPNNWKNFYKEYKITGKIFTFGVNIYGQLGLKDNINRDIPEKVSNVKIKQISTGNMHTIMIDFNDNVWVFGSNCSGQLGLGDYLNRSEPNQIPNIKAKKVSAGSSHTVIINFNNNIFTFGLNTCGQLGLDDFLNRIKPTEIPNIKGLKVSAGNNSTAIIDLDNNIFTFGLNNYGQLGFNDKLNRKVTILVPNIMAKEISMGYFGWGL